MAGSFSENFLNKLARKLGSDELQLGLELGLATDVITRIQADNRGQQHNIIYNILFKWSKNVSGSEVDMEKELCTAFKELGRNDIVRFIKDAPKKFEVLTTPFQPEGSVQPTQEAKSLTEDFNKKLKVSQEVSKEAARKLPDKRVRGDGDGKLIMLSYQWDNQELMKRIRDRLNKKGYKVWMDVDNMTGSLLTSMSQGVEDASVVIIAASQKYKESANCEKEAQYAHRMNRVIIPLMVEPGYSPDGWLGILATTILYIDFTKKRPFDDPMDELIKEIGRRLDDSQNK